MPELESLSLKYCGLTETSFTSLTTAEQDLNEQRSYSEDMDWMDYVISCAANVDMDEITDEIYQNFMLLIGIPYVS